MLHPICATCGSRNWLIGTLVLSLLAMSGNLLSVELFFAIAFLFGSIATVLAVALYGTVSAVIVAVFGSLHTITLFGHPYAVIVFALEAMVVGILYRRGIRNLVLADLLYWGVLGILLVIVFYKGAIGMSWVPTLLIAFKQALNGIFNALMAAIILTLVAIYPQRFLQFKPELLKVKNIFFIVGVSTILLASVFPLVHQSYVLKDEREQRLVMYLLDEAKDLASVIKKAESNPLAIQNMLQYEDIHEGYNAVIVGHNNEIIAMHGDFKGMSDTGRLKVLSDTASIWSPKGDMPAMLRWKKSYYQASHPFKNNLLISRIIVEMSAAPLVEYLEQSNLYLFMFIAGFLVLGVFGVKAVSYWFARPIELLDEAGKGLEGKVYSGQRISFPESSIYEFQSLGNTLRLMSSNLAENFETLQHSKEILETQVKKRTQELEFVNTNLKDRQYALDQHAIVSVSDAAGTIVFANEKFCEISGYKYEEVIGQRHRLLKSGEHPDSFYAELWATITQGGTWSGEICNRRKDGSLYWVQSTITPFLDSIGKPFQYIAIRTDITHVKAAEIELRESEERMSLAIEGSGDGIWDWDIVNEKMSFSRLYESMLGYEEHELKAVPDTWIGSVHPEDIGHVQETLERYFKAEIADYAVELRLQCKDESYKWIMCRGKLVSKDESGKPARMIGIHTDISERKQSEEKINLATDQLNRAQAIAKIGSWEFNLMTHELAWSKEHYKIFELTELPSDQLYDAYRSKVHEDDIEQLDRLINNVKETGESFPYEHRMRCNDGSIKYLLAISECVFDGAGNAQILRGTVQDITDHKRSEQILIAAREEADRANRAKSEFLSSMSHELRTPMNAILGFGQLLEMDGGLSVDQLENVQDIMKGGNHLLSLINEVLDLAKIESGNIDLSIEPVELTEIVEECFNLMEPLAVNSNIDISHCEFRGAVVRADRIRLKQALINLLSNAIKYNKENGTVRIEIEAAEDNQIRIKITDTGHGISKEQLKDLFEPFNRLDAKESEIEGTGIGLTITRRIIELMGGVIGVKSEAGVGSSFWIELPLEAMEPSDSGPATLSGISDNKIELERQRKVLYIDDNPVNLKLVSRVLGMKPHIHLMTAHTPTLGLELADTHVPELILLDINMPGMNGYEVLAHLKKDNRFVDVPVVAVSADAMPQDIERGITAGFNGYITKPVDFEIFNSKVDDLLSGKA